MAGVCPQSIYFTEDQARRSRNRQDVEVSVELVENMGDRSLVVGRSRSALFVRFMITHEEEIEPGGKMKVSDGRRMHLFDSLIRLNILD